MQIDFHHTVTYVAARLAGFGHEDASVVAYCAQYVDDATNGGVIHFDTGAMYSRVASAHKTLDYKNFKSLANHHVWIPFHFLPGNGGMKAGEKGSLSFAERIVCRPDSPVARDMIRACIEARDEPGNLHRLGITMHVYADTWAHQGFSGITDEANDVEIVEGEEEEERGLKARLARFFGDAFDRVANRLVGDVLPLGHGAALSWPDLPYLTWSYERKGKIVERDNTEDFVAAANEMCKAMRRYRAGSPDAKVVGLPAADKATIRDLFIATNEKDSEKRHRTWLEAIGRGDFSFPAVDLAYRGKGKASWKYLALQTARKKDRRNEIFPYSESFMERDWKLFHDSLQAHRFAVLREILPRYGICTA